MAAFNKTLAAGLAAQGLRLKGLETLRAPNLALSAAALANAGQKFIFQPQAVPTRGPALTADVLTAVRPDLTKFRPELFRPDILKRPVPLPRPLPPRRPAPTPATPDVAATEPPPAPRENPFEDLPFRSPGDRIVADDFNRLSKALDQIARAAQLSSALFGSRFGQARSLLEAHGYEIRRAISVFGNQVADLHQDSAADRLVVSVSLVSLGAPAVDVVLSERVEGRRFVPDLRGQTYPQARQAIRNLLADVPVPAPPGPTPNLVGSSLSSLQTQF